MVHGVHRNGRRGTGRRVKNGKEELGDRGDMGKGDLGVKFSAVAQLHVLLTQAFLCSLALIPSPSELSTDSSETSSSLAALKR